MVVDWNRPGEISRLPRIFTNSNLEDFLPSYVWMVICTFRLGQKSKTLKRCMGSITKMPQIAPISALFISRHGGESMTGFIHADIQTGRWTLCCYYVMRLSISPTRRAHPGEQWKDNSRQTWGWLDPQGRGDWLDDELFLQLLECLGGAAFGAGKCGRPKRGWGCTWSTPYKENA